MKNITKTLGLALVLALPLACSDRDAKVASYNLSEQGDNFQLNRRVVFYNGITGAYMLVVEGKLSIRHAGGQLEVTVKTGPSEFKKHFLGLSNNVTYFCEQLEASTTSAYHYKVVFKPSVIVPDINFKL